MNKFQKIFSSALAALIVLSGSVLPAGAACKTNSCNSGKKICIAGTCGSNKCCTALDFLKSSCNDLNCILEKYGKTCSSGSCAPSVQPSTQAPSQPATQPATQPTTQPETQPATQTPETTQPAAAPDTSAADSAYNRAYEDEVIRLVNAERAKYGLSALAKNDLAAKGAEIRAQEITKQFSHTRPDGTSCFTVCKQLGISYRSVGENIAYGQRSPQQVVNGWMNSEGHRKNILSASFTSIGVGCYQQGNTLYWSQLFIG